MISFPPKKILVPLDFTDASHSGLKTGLELAKVYNATLELVYAYRFPSMVGEYESIAVVSAARIKAYRKFVQASLKEAAGDFPRARLKVRVVEGFAADIVVGEAAGRPDTLIVMGTRAITGMRRVFEGSVTETVVRHSDAPVLALHQGAELSRPAKILAPFNGEDYSIAALRYALRWAAGSGARVQALYVAGSGAEAGKAAADFRPWLERLLKTEPSQALRLVVRDGDVDRAIIEEAVQGRFDLIVLSAHRKPLWKDFRLGTTAERVLRQSPIPVLTVPCTVKAPSAAQLRKEHSNYLERVVASKIY